ncbi:MAG: esterase/lipase family protein [Thermodesulfobacteriota bacterium]
MKQDRKGETGKAMPRLEGLKDLVFDVVEEVTNLVERTHLSVSERTTRRFAPVEPLSTPGSALQTAHDKTAEGVYGTIRTVNRGVRQALNAAFQVLASESVARQMRRTLDPGTPVRSDAAGTWSWLADHGESALNAFYGDYLHNRNNALDLGMTLRHQGNILPVEPKALRRALPEAGPRICVFVHGLGCTEWSWSLSAQRFYGDAAVNFGVLLERDLGITPLYVRYNTGRHISENGRLLSSLLTRILEAYPAELTEIILIGHSMGGLVARSAACHGAAGQEPWMSRLSRIFSLGSPNLGAPLEKAANVVSNLLQVFDTAGTQVPGELLDTRSSGIKDLRFGYTIDEEWADRDPDRLLENQRCEAPFVDGVAYYFLGATVTRDADHPMGRLLGDLVVRPESAAGTAFVGRRFPFAMNMVFGGMNHFHLANHPDVYAAIRKCIENQLPENEIT